jgi:hypothetical protein
MKSMTSGSERWLQLWMGCESFAGITMAAPIESNARTIASARLAAAPRAHAARKACARAGRARATCVFVARGAGGASGPDLATQEPSCRTAVSSSPGSPSS